MPRYSAILPGARVRTADGFIGTVERLDRHDAGVPDPGDADQRDTMLVRSEDRHWRYAIPLMLVERVQQGPFSTIVHLTLEADRLPQYIVESLDGERPTDEGITRTGATPTQGSDAASGDRADDSADVQTIRVPLAEEELVARKRPVTLGHVHVHKAVVSREEQLRVPVTHEEVLVEHLPPEAHDGRPADNPNDLYIPVLEERLVVQRQTVVREWIRVSKRLETREYEVRGTVRREVLTVREDRDADAPDALADTPLLHESGATDANAAPTTQ